MATTKIVLRLPLKNPTLLPDYIEKWVADGISLVWAYGEGADAFHDEIDWKLVEMGIEFGRMPVTIATDPSRRDKVTFEEVCDNAKSWISDPPGETDIITF